MSTLTDIGGAEETLQTVSVGRHLMHQVAQWRTLVRQNEGQTIWR